jgi:hypothetical protein
LQGEGDFATTNTKDGEPPHRRVRLDARVDPDIAAFGEAAGASVPSNCF